MNRITNVKRRPRTRAYSSPLRDERADDTRQRILEALVRTMAGGAAGLSVPAVAREARVSIPTVYRYFKTKADLVTALGPYIEERNPLMRPPDASHGIGSIVREMAARHATLDPELRAAMASDVGGEVRRRHMPRRIAMIAAALKQLVPGISREELDRLTRVTLILMATPTIRAFEEYLDKSPVDAGEDVAWTLETLVGALRRRRA